MNCNNNTGTYMPVRYAEVGALEMQTQWGQACPVNPELPANNLPAVPQPSLPETMPGGQIPDDISENLEDYIFTPGFLRANIGNLLRVEFLIGNNTTDRVGILREVGASYIVLESLDGSSRIMCDIFSIRFVTILRTPTEISVTGNFMEP